MLISYSVAHAGLFPMSAVPPVARTRDVLAVDIEVVPVAFGLVDDDDFVGSSEEKLLGTERVG